MSHLKRAKQGLEEGEEEYMRDFGYAHLTAVEAILGEHQQQGLSCKFSQHRALALHKEANLLRTSPAGAAAAVAELTRLFDLDNTTLKLGCGEVPTREGLEGFSKAAKQAAQAKSSPAASFSEGLAYAAFFACLKLKQDPEAALDPDKFVKPFEPRASECSVAWRKGDSPKQCLALMLVDDGVASRVNKLNLLGKPALGGWHQQGLMVLFSAVV